MDARARTRVVGEIAGDGARGLLRFFPVLSVSLWLRFV